MAHHTLTALLCAALASACASRTTSETTTADPSRASRTRAATEVSTPARTGGEARAEGSCDLHAVHYAFDSSDLDQTARNKLEANARCLHRKHQTTAAVIGMTDSRGTEEYNLALGDRRARAATQYMTALGVEPSRLRPHSVGEEHANGDEEQGWGEDRRADVRAD